MSTQNKPLSRAKLGLIIMCYIAFIALGMPDGLGGIAWPSVRELFGLRLDSIAALMVVGTSGYMVSSFFSGKIIAKVGVGGTLIASCALTGMALLGYTLVPAWWMYVSLAFFAGLGAGAIDAGLNTYVASHFGEGLMQWLHASYGVGVTIGPILMTVGLNVFRTWRFGYQVVAAAQVLLALTFVVTIKMWQDHGSEPDVHAPEAERKLTDYKTPYKETLARPSTWMNMLLFFLYTGAEFSFGTWTYSLLTLSRGVPVSVAALWSGSYWATFTIGRVLAGLLTRRFGNENMLRGGLLLAFAGSLLLWWNPFYSSSIIAVALIGFAVAPIFPAMVSGTSARVGDKHAANVIGMQITAAGFGGMVVPALAGWIGQNIKLEGIPVYLAGVFLVLVVVYFGMPRPKVLAA
jgi:fucose permease